MRNKINELNNLKKEIENILDFCDNELEKLFEKLENLENEIK